MSVKLSRITTSKNLINPLSSKYLAKMAVKFSIVGVAVFSSSHRYDVMT